MSAVMPIVRKLPPNATSSGWVCLSVPSLARMAALEILSESESLNIPKVTQDALRMISVDKSKTLTKLKMWVDTDSLDWLVKNRDTEQHRQTALEFCIQRQAHYPLLKHLFKITRLEALELREQLQAPLPPTKPKHIATDDLMSIFDYWRELGKDYELAIDRWVLLALKFPDYPLASLYAAIWVEPSLPRNHQALGSALQGGVQL